MFAFKDLIKRSVLRKIGLKFLVHYKCSEQGQYWIKNQKSDISHYGPNKRVIFTCTCYYIINWPFQPLVIVKFTQWYAPRHLFHFGKLTIFSKRACNKVNHFNYRATSPITEKRPRSRYGYLRTDNQSITILDSAKLHIVMCIQIRSASLIVKMVLYLPPYILHI